MKVTYLFFLIYFLNQSFSIACNCSDEADSIKESFIGSDVVLHGKVVKQKTISVLKTLSKEDLKSVKEATKWEDFEVIKVTVRVIQKYKSNTNQRRVAFYTSKYNNSCGYQFFSKGNEFIIYANNDNYLAPLLGLTKAKNNAKSFWTSQCTRTRWFNFEEDSELRKI